MKGHLQFYFLLIFITFSNSYAQNDIVFEKLSIENNDIQSVVYSICYDSYGNVWFATEEGLVRFNSKDYYLYNTNNGLPENLGNRIFSIIKDSDNHLWIGSEKGVAIYDSNKNVFIEIKTEYEKNAKTNFIIEDNKKNIWVAKNNGLWKFNKVEQSTKAKHFFKGLLINSICNIDNEIYVLSDKGIFSFPNNSSSVTLKNVKNISRNITNGSVIKYLNHKILIGTKDGKLFEYSKNSNEFKEIFFSPKQKGLTIRDIEFKNYEYYIAIDGEGLMILDTNFKLKKHYYNDEDNPISISSNGVYDIYFGNDKINWFATYGGGVNYTSESKQIFKILKHQINNPNSLAYNTSRTILEVDNTIWFGTKKGISIYDKNTKNWSHLNNFPNLNKNTEEVILSLIKDNEYVWAGTYYHGLYRISIKNKTIESFNALKTTNKLLTQKIFKLFKDNQNNIWVGGIDGQLSVIDRNFSLKEYNISDIRDINQRFDGKIIATGKEGVFIVDPQSNKFEKIDLLNEENKIIQFNTINTFVSNEKELILGTNGAGLLSYNWQTKKTKNLNNGLPSNIIQGIIEYNKDYWISTTKGISVLTFSNDDYTIKNFTKTDGLSSSEFNYGAFAKLSNNEIAFGGLDGVTLFNPEKIKSRNIQPKIYFEDFYLDNELVKDEKILPRQINEVDEINLKYNQNSFGFKFVGILQGFASKVKYTYKLEGFDENWSDPNSKTQVNYTNLSPGEYNFLIKSSDEQGNFGKERSIKININSPWYASGFAYVVYLLLLIIAIYALINIIKILEIKKNKEEQISFFNNITHEIKTPLSILLNSLEDKNNDQNNRVKSSIERINSLINQMLNFQRFSISENTTLQISKINVNDFINNIINDFQPLLKQKNLAIEVQNSFSKELFYYDEDFLNKIVFNLISNAIKYSFEDNKILINLESVEENKLLIKVKDFGIGIPKEAQKNILTKFFRAKNVMNNQFSGTGLGLMIVKNIVEKSNGKITFKSSDNKGTIFKVTLPSFEKLYSESTILNRDLSEIEINQEIEKYSDKKVLVVEDNDDLRDYLVKTLENYFLVYEAKNGKEGLDLASKIYPDLIFTDYMMPEMDGFEMCLKLKDDINLNHIPIFMLTALHNTMHKKHSTEIGVTEYIEKPLNISFLLAKTISVFSWQENIREHYKHQTDIDIAGKNKNLKENEFLSNLEAIILDKIKDESFSLQDICNIIGMSRTSLYMKLKNLIDLSPQDFIIHTKLKYSKKLLIEGDSNIKEVAYASGFSNPKYFSTSFKKAFGISPSEFIKNLNK